MGLATAESILNAQDYDYKDVEVRHWGTVRIRMLTAPERLGFLRRFKTEVEGDAALKLTLEIIAAATVNEDGSPLFSAEQLDLLARKNWSNLQDLAVEVLKFNAVTEELIKESEKNLGPARNGCSPSGTASPSESLTQTLSP